MAAVMAFSAVPVIPVFAAETAALELTVNVTESSLSVPDAGSVNSVASAVFTNDEPAEIANPEYDATWDESEYDPNPEDPTIPNPSLDYAYFDPDGEPGDNVTLADAAAAVTFTAAGLVPGVTFENSTLSVSSATVLTEDITVTITGTLADTAFPGISGFSETETVTVTANGGAENLPGNLADALAAVLDPLFYAEPDVLVPQLPANTALVDPLNAVTETWQPPVALVANNIAVNAPTTTARGNVTITFPEAAGFNPWSWEFGAILTQPPLPPMTEQILEENATTLEALGGAINYNDLLIPEGQPNAGDVDSALLINLLREIVVEDTRANGFAFNFEPSTSIDVEGIIWYLGDPDERVLNPLPGGPWPYGDGNIDLEAEFWAPFDMTIAPLAAITQPALNAIRDGLQLALPNMNHNEVTDQHNQVY